MGWVEAVVTVLKAWAWPVVVLIGVVTLRKELAKLITRLTRFSGPGGVEAEFANEAAATSELAEAAVPNAPNQLAPSPPSASGGHEGTPELSPQPTLDELLRETDLHPIGGMIRAWNVVESVIDREFRGDSRRPVSPVNVVHQLAAGGLLTYELDAVASRLQKMRSQVVHGAVIPTCEAAREFVTAAWRLASALNKAATDLRDVMDIDARPSS